MSGVILKVSLSDFADALINTVNFFMVMAQDSHDFLGDPDYASEGNYIDP